MKTILALLLTVVALTGTAQTVVVTNLNVDLVITQPVDDALRISWKVDDNLRTNGVAPYTNIQVSITYKQFLAQSFSNGIPDASVINSQNEAALLAQLRSIRDTDPQRYARIYRIAFNKGNQ